MIIVISTILYSPRQYGWRIIQEITHGVNSVATMEVRAMKRANTLTISYLPIIFFVYGFLLGITLSKKVVLFY